MTPIQKQLEASKSSRAPKLTKDDHAYIALLVNYCLLAGIRDPESVLAGEEFTIEGVDFRLIRRWRESPDLVFLLCDLFPVPEGQEEACYRTLLEANMHRPGGLSSTLGICPETGWVVGSVRLPLHGADAGLLHACTHAFVKEAQAWRTAMAHAEGNVPPAPPQFATAQEFPPYNDAFIRLLVDYCKVNRLDGAEAILTGAPLLVQNVPFVFYGYGPANPDTIRVYCDYGALQQGKETEEICHALLIANLTLHPHSRQALMLSAETGHILLAQDFQPASLKPRSLQNVLEKLAEGSLRWRGSLR